MKNAGKILFLLFFVFALLSFISALEVKKSEVVVVTEPYQNISAVVKSISGEELQTFAGRARKFGEYRFTYYGVVDKIKLSVSIMNNESQESIVSKDFGPYAMGSPINVTLKLLESVKVEAVVKDIVTESNVTSNVSNSGSSPLTGRVVGGSVKQASPAYYYVGMAIIVIGLAVFIVRRRFSSAKGIPKEPDHQKMFSKKEEKAQVKEEFTPPVEATVITPDKTNAQEIQQKIADLQKQLEQVRGEEKLIRLQKQLAREQQELGKLKNSGEPKKDLVKKSNISDFNNGL